MNELKVGLFLVDEPTVITSVEPLDGHEGTIVTLKGSGFAKHVRNNCVVLGGMGACARAQPGSTSTELKVRIDPVAKASQGDVLMWPGPGSNFYTEKISFGGTALHFSEIALFRNGAPLTSAGVNFRLTKASPNTFGGILEKSAGRYASLSGHEDGPALRLRFPKELSFGDPSAVDICLVLKEPTLALDFTAEISRRDNNLEDCLRAIAKSITVNTGLVGERVYTDVVRNDATGEFDLYVTKPYLVNGMLTVHFNASAG